MSEAVTAADRFDFDRVVDRRPTESSKWHTYPDGVLPLWVADMDFPSPEPVIQALRARVDHGVFGYGIEQPALVEAVVERLGRRYGWHIKPEAVVSLPGVIPGFNLVGRALARPGDGMLVQTPAYPPILRVAGNAGLTREEAPLARGPEGRYEADLDALRAAIGERTRVFLLCNPHNPVGRVFDRRELAAMAEICLRRGLVICADEIHCEVLFAGREHIPIAALDPEVEARTITLMSPSKTFNLAGLKFALAIIPNPELRERFLAARADLVQVPNILGAAAALAAYREGQAWLEALLRYLEANRDFLLAYVRERLPGIAMAPPEATYLGWLDCRGAALPGPAPAAFFLERARVALHEGTAFGRGGEGFARLNFGCPRATLEAALERMRAALAG
jgi:cysteine-S-conjugate beta-lyase